MPDGGDASKNASRDGILQRAAMATALVRACACLVDLSDGVDMTESEEK